MKCYVLVLLLSFFVFKLSWCLVAFPVSHAGVHVSSFFGSPAEGAGRRQRTADDAVPVSPGVGCRLTAPYRCIRVAGRHRGWRHGDGRSRRRRTATRVIYSAQTLEHRLGAPVAPTRSRAPAAPRRHWPRWRYHRLTKASAAHTGRRRRVASARSRRSSPVVVVASPVLPELFLLSRPVGSVRGNGVGQGFRCCQCGGIASRSARVATDSPDVAGHRWRPSVPRDCRRRCRAELRD